MMQQPPKRSRGRFAAFAASVALATVAPLVGSGIATAATAPVVAPPPPTTSFSASELGLPPSIVLTSPGASETVVVPVPTGLTLGTLSGVAAVPISSNAAALEFTSNGTVIGTASIPATTAAQPTVPFSVPISFANVTNGNATITITYRAITTQLGFFCGATQPVTLSQLSVSYTGNGQQPTSISTFLPAVLKNLDIYIPSNPSVSIQQAALDIELETVSRYSPSPVSVTLHTWDGSSTLPPVPTSTFERSILVRSSPQAGSAIETDGLGAPVLVMQGQGSALGNQTLVLAGAPKAAAQGTAASVLNVGAVPSLASQRQSFSQLGVSGSVTGVGIMNLGLGIEEAKFGGAVNQFNLHLISHYTPVTSNEKATAVVSVGSKVLSTNVLNSSGLLTTNLVIPATLISQTTSIQIAISYDPANGCLTSGRQLTYSIDPQSYVDATLVSGGVGGFDALGAGLLPTFQVGLGSGSQLQELEIALQVAQSIQQVTPVLLTGKVTPLSTVLSSSVPALIVAPASQLPSSLDPPVGLKAQTTSSISSSSSTSSATVQTNAAVATLQAFDQTSSNRTVLLASTAGSWSTFAPITSQLLGTGASAGWNYLSGDTLLVGPGGQVNSLAIRAGAPQQNSLLPDTGNSLIKIGLLISGIVIIVLLLAITGLSRRRKRQRRSGAPS